MGKVYRSRSARGGFWRRRDADFHEVRHRVHALKYVGYVIMGGVIIILTLFACVVPLI